MKELPKPMDVMKTMHQYIADAYNELPLKEKGIIQFCLHEKNDMITCYFDANGEELKFVEGMSDTCDVKIESSLNDWLALAAKKLHPFIGVITRKIRFTGDVSYFKKIIPNEIYNIHLDPFSDEITDFEVNPVKTWKKPEKVLLIDSSPRGSRGYTKLYSDHIERYLLEKNLTVNHIQLSHYKILPCSGCLHCWLKNDGECVLKDDVKKLYELYEESDLIIYSFPLYAYSVPGMLKNFMDRGVMRQYPYFEKGITEIRHPRRNKSTKSIVVFSICGFPGIHQFDAVKPLFKLYSHSSHSPLIAEIYRPGGIFLIQNPFNYPVLKKFLEALRESMHQIVENGRIENQTKKHLNIRINQSAFLESTNKYWDNLYKSNDVNY